MVSTKICKSVSMILVLLVTWLGVSSATLYKIEWNDNSVIDYKTLSSEHKFHVGDVIVFKYVPKEDSVVRVTHKNFQSCNATNPIRVMDSGEDSVTIRSPHAHLYFISGVPSRCKAGQKVYFRVSQPSSHHHSPPPSAAQPNAAPAPAPGPTSAANPSLGSKGKALVALMMVIGFLFY